MKISSFSSKSNKIDMNGSYLIMDMGAIDQNGYNISSKLTLSNKDLLSKGEIILVKDDIGGGNIIGKCCIIDQNDKYVCGDHVFKINLNDDIDKLYFCYYNNFINERRYLQVMTGTSQKSITKGVLEKFTITYIDMERQTKIGSFFKELDELISNYQKMSKLWKESFLHYSNKFFPLHYDKYIRVEDIASERKEMDFSNDYNHLSLTIDGLIPKTDQYNRDFLMADKENKKFKVTRINDICYNPANLKFNVITMNQIGTGIFSPIYVTLETKNIDKLYSKYLFTSKNFIKMARKYEEGTITERIGVKL